MKRCGVLLTYPAFFLFAFSHAFYVRHWYVLGAMTFMLGCALVGTFALLSLDEFRGSNPPD